MNLLQETLDALKENGKTPEDITFIGDESGQYGCTWEEFINLANAEYTFDPDAYTFTEPDGTIVEFGFSRFEDLGPSTGKAPVDVSDMVAADLVIHFSDHSLMHRREFNGEAGWYFHPAFKPAEKLKGIKSLIGTVEFPHAPTVRSLNDVGIQKKEQSFFIPPTSSVN